jgi:alanyl-tRNA synthetase
LGYFRILKESSIAAGVRRIEAACGKAAEDLAYQTEDLAQQTAASLKTPLASLPAKVAALIEENKEQQAQLKTFKRASLKEMARSYAKKIKTIGSCHFLAIQVQLDSESMQFLADELMSEHKSLLLLLALKDKERCQILVRVSPDLVQKGVNAQALVKEIAPHIQGSGGGKPDSAQAGGKDPEGIASAIQAARHHVEKLCK